MCGNVIKLCDAQLSLYAIRLHKLGGKKCPKLAKNESFLKRFFKVHFEAMPAVQKIFQRYNCCIYISTQLRAPSLKAVTYAELKVKK